MFDVSSSASDTKKVISFTFSKLFCKTTYQIFIFKCPSQIFMED